MKRIEEITLFYEISQALNEHLELKKSLYKVLDILSSSLDMGRGTVSILNPLRNEISIEVAHSLSPSTIERVKYKLGEGITGRVIQTGKALAIPKISEEPLFLDRTASRRIRKGFKELSFICVPIKKGNQVIGGVKCGSYLRKRIFAERGPETAFRCGHHDCPACHQPGNHSP